MCTFICENLNDGLIISKEGTDGQDYCFVVSEIPLELIQGVVQSWLVRVAADVTVVNYTTICKAFSSICVCIA